MNINSVNNTLIFNQSALSLNAQFQLGLVNTVMAFNDDDNCTFSGDISFNANNENNLEDGNSCQPALGDHSFIASDPRLLPLRDDALAWHRYAPLANNSDIIDFGSNLNCSIADQIGTPSPLDGGGDGNAICDIGAIEFTGLLFQNGFEDTAAQ